MATSDSTSDFEFDCVVKEAEKWTTRSEVLFEIVASDRWEQRIYFCIHDKKHMTFYVTVQMKDIAGYLNQVLQLWSENTEMLNCLRPVIESSTFTNISFTLMLQEINKCLKKFLESSGRYDVKGDDDVYGECEDDDDDDDDGGYYNNGDTEVLDPTEEKETKKNDDSSDEDDDEQLFQANGNPTAIYRLTRELKLMKKISGRFGFQGAPRGNNLFIWDVTLIDIPESTLLGKDVKKYAEKYYVEPVISMEMHFPNSYPYDPPFIRIVKPRFKFLTGHVTIGGSICMELLTKRGWLPSYDIESVLVQVRSVILSDDRAQLDSYNPNVPYTMEEAKVAFNRMVAKYGWQK